MPLPTRPTTRILTFTTLTLALLPTPTPAIDFTFLYTDPDGQGFFDPATGAQRRAALNVAGDIVGQLIRPTHIGEEVVVRVNSYTDTTVTTLASARPAFFYGNFGSTDPAYQSDTHYPKALASHLVGHDVEPAKDDVTMNVNFGQPYYFGTDGAVPVGQYDFISVAAHELIHGLGFYDSFRQQGGFGLFGDGTFDTNTGQSGLPVIYDRFLTVGPGGNGLLSLSQSARQSGLISNNLFWSGTNGTTGNGGTPARINAPNPFVNGSSTAHLDQTAYPNDIMSPTLGFQQLTQTLSAVTRGILRDLGWDISVTSSNVTWTPPSPANNLASNFNNWSQQPYPGDNLTFGNHPANVTDVKMDLQLYTHGEFRFTAAAPAYTLRLRSYTGTSLTGDGIRNDGPAPHTVVLETYGDDLGGSGTVPAYAGSAAILAFKNNATASNTIFQVHAGFTEYHQVPNSPTTYNRYAGAAVEFQNNSNAGTATFHIAGATGDGAPATFARVNFRNTASAASATFNNQPGNLGVALPVGSFAVGFGARTNFFDTSTASSATLNNLALNTGPAGTGGITNFFNSANAGSATVNNFGSTNVNSQGLGGRTQFFDSSSSATATFNNHPSPFAAGVGATTFSGSASAPSGVVIDPADAPSAPSSLSAPAGFASAGSATFNNLAGTGFLHSGGATRFYGNSSAANATFHNFAPAPGTSAFGGVTEFRESSTAANATLINHLGSGGGRTEFYDNATAGNANLVIPAQTVPGTHGAYVVFRNASTAGSANVTAGAFANSIVDFLHTSSAASANVTLAPSSGTYVRFYDSATAAAATFDLGHNSQLQFYTASSAGSANITVRSYANLSFSGDFNPQNNPTVSAGTATIRLLGGTTSTFWGGAANFSTWSTAASATFIVDGAAHPNTRGGSVNFDYSAHMGSASITLNPATQPNSTGGELYVRRGATGEGARVYTSPGSLADFGGNAFYNGTSLGHIEGAGTVVLGGAELRVGYLGLPATLSGPVVNGPSNLGGSLTKVGPATLTLAGPNDYDGLTTVAQGALLLTGSNAKPGSYAVAPGASLTFNSPHTLASLTSTGNVTFNAPITLAPDSDPSSLANLVLGLGATIDLTNNPLSLASYTPAQVRQLILTGRLLSSTPDPTNTLSLGYLPANPGTRIQNTLTGDANLDLLLNADDFALLDKGFATGGTLWHQGDFTHDGVVNQLDYLALDRTYALTHPQGLQSLSPSLLAQRQSQFGPNYISELLTSIPEPSFLLPSTFCLLTYPFRPRRHRR